MTAPRKALTRDEAIAAISAATPLSPQDLDGFLACTDEERAALIQAYKDAGTMPSASAWDVVLDILKVCADLAALIIPITGAITGVYSLKDI